MRIELLTDAHEREAFDCGAPELNEYLRRAARQHGEKGISRTFVLVEPESPGKILGFVTLAVGEVEAAAVPPRVARRLPRRLPVARLARLAVSADRQRNGLGELLLTFALRRTVQVASSVGLVGVFVDAKNERAQAFYRRYGFIPLQDEPLKLFLPIATLAAAFR